MIKWRFIAKRLADEFTVPTSLGGHWNVEHLMRTWNSLFDFDPKDYADRASMTGNYAIIFNFFLTLANQSNASDKDKVENQLLLLENIKSVYDRKIVQKIYRDAGYEFIIPTEQLSLSLSKLHSFHPEVLKHCSKLFEQGHYSNCINECCKAYNKAVKEKAQSAKDGFDLMLSAFGEKGNLRINSYLAESEKDEQEGIKFMSAGLMRGLRNPTSHETAESLKIKLEDCIEILGLASYLFKQLEKSATIKKIVK